jgi:SAM-dependent methyltransferase
VQEAKRILDLVDALALVIRKCPDVEAALIGGGDQLPEVQERINRHMLNNDIKILGTVPSEEIQKTLADYDVVVLLSDHEGTPCAVMDGMAAGLVPVCLDIPGGVRELVIHEQTGLLVKDRGNDFLQAVERLIADEALRTSLSINARAHIKEHFSLEVTADRWETFSAELIREAGPRSPLKIPKFFSLPPVKSELSREDRRQPPLLNRTVRSIIRFFRGHDSVMHSDFLSPVCIPGKLDTFPIRRSILSSLQKALVRFEGVLLDVGCGQMPYKSLLTAQPSKVVRYIGLDLQNNPIHLNHPDIVWRDGKIPLENDSVDCAISTEVFEHCPDPEAVMKEIFRVLKPGGILFFTVPFLWPLHEVPFDEYRYTPFSLRRHLINSGFVDVELEVFGGWDASLAQMLGLWIRRRPMRRWLRRVMSLMVWPLVYFLFKLDSGSSTEIRESSMITGFSGMARKPGKELP